MIPSCPEDRLRLQTRNAVALVLMTLLPAMTALAQESHVVPLTQLHQDAARATEGREANLAKVAGFLSSDAARESLRAVKIDGDRVMQALPLLSDEEVARLASRAEQAQSDFSAGALSNLHLTYIVIALATAVIILIIVKA